MGVQEPLTASPRLGFLSSSLLHGNSYTRPCTEELCQYTFRSVSTASVVIEGEESDVDP